MLPSCGHCGITIRQIDYDDHTSRTFWVHTKIVNDKNGVHFEDIGIYCPRTVATPKRQHRYYPATRVLA